MRARTEIDVADYVAAFRAWISVAHDRDDGDLAARQRAFVNEACHWLTRQHRGVVKIATLCDVLGNRGPRRDLGLLPEIGKSCLLSRLIYGGEQLRTRECPIHGGRWSGYLIDPCPAGCNYGLNVTGWLPNDLVERWPDRPHDPAIDSLEATLRRNFGNAELTVYADRLQTLGDVRGELITIDLVDSLTPDLAARRDELATAWLGRLASSPGPDMRSPATLARQPYVRTGFLDVTLTTPEEVRALFDHPAGCYLRWLRIDANAYATLGIVRFLALRDHAWLAELTIADRSAKGLPDAIAQLRQRAPLLGQVR